MVFITIFAKNKNQLKVNNKLKIKINQFQLKEMNFQLQKEEIIKKNQPF